MNQKKIVQCISAQRKGILLIKRAMLIVFVSVLLGQTGCGTKETVYLETPDAGTENAAGQDTEETCRTQAQGTESPGCYVYLCGAVSAPGVYLLPEGSRVYEAVAAAGGLLPEAEPSAVNQAEAVYDGQMIRIPTTEEAEALPADGAGTEAEPSDGRINLNTAGLSDLMTLPGIGQSKAEKIIAYRTESGGFASVEELMNVEGIKEGVFNRVKDSIKVK